VREAIPSHCFKRSYTISLRYLIVDLAIIFALFYAATFIDACSYGLLRVILWVTYWMVQGCIMTGLWVIGHECGHGGFTDSDILNDVVGWVVHSALLVPYFSWKISHRRHHSNTGSVSRDEVFVPPVKSVDQAEDEHEDSITSEIVSTFRRLFHIVIMFTIGWPLYLTINATGRPYPKGRWVNHFLPTSPIFTSDKERIQVLVSDMGLIIALGFLWKLSSMFSFLWMAKMYGIPYLITNFFLVLITFLQHTDHAVPHYDDDQWEWMRGALATVDRDYGILNHVFHHICDTHVVHHLFFQLPHYHAVEATKAVKKVLGAYYRYDSTPIAKALWESFACEHVQPDAGAKGPEAGVLWFRKPSSRKHKHI